MTIQYLLLKTNKDCTHEIESISPSKEDASLQLITKIKSGTLNKMINSNVLKVYENNAFFRNKSLFLYQIVEIDVDSDMDFLILKTSRDLTVEVYSAHDTREQASLSLTSISPSNNNILESEGILKIFENNYILPNNLSYVYQIIEI